MLAAAAPQLGQILGEHDGVERGILGGELRQEAVLRGRARLRRSQDEPSGPARVRAVRRCGHQRPGVTWSPLSRCLARRPAHALGVAGDGHITAGVATRSECSEEAHGGAAPRVPAFEDIGGVGREKPAAAVTARLALGNRGGRSARRTICLPMPSWVALACPGHPWRGKAPICGRAPTVGPAGGGRAPALFGGDGGDIGTATVPSDGVTGPWRRAS